MQLNIRYQILHVNKRFDIGFTTDITYFDYFQVECF